MKEDRAERYEASGLTSFAGLELIARFLRALNFKGHLRRIQASLPASDFGSVPMVLLVLVMPITGARRVRHVGYVEGDLVVPEDLDSAERIAAGAGHDHGSDSSDTETDSHATDDSPEDGTDDEGWPISRIAWSSQPFSGGESPEADHNDDTYSHLEGDDNHDL